VFYWIVDFRMIFAVSGQVIVQGLTGPLGMTIVPAMQQYGTRVVAGVMPGQGGQMACGLAVFDAVQSVVAEWGAIATSVICVDPYQVLDAAREAMQAGIRQLVLISQGVPPLDMVRLVQTAQSSGTLVVGANSAGVIVPGQLLLGVHPPHCYTAGAVGIISRAGTLTYAVARVLTAAGLGQSIAVSIGSDPIVGSTLTQWLQLLEADAQTEVIVLVGQVGSDAEEIAAQGIRAGMTKPVVAYIAGQMAPRHRRLGHANAILAAHSLDLGRDWGTVVSQTQAFKRAGVPVAASLAQLPQLLRQLMAVDRAMPETA
jgi:succinyl-CoA synthetase alpha subunit